MVQILKNKKVKVIICLMIILIMLVLTMKQSYAAGDVSSVIQQAWKQMESQIKNILFACLTFSLIAPNYIWKVL